MIKLALLGATGRMGASVLSLLPDEPRFELTAALTTSDDPRFGQVMGAPPLLGVGDGGVAGASVRATDTTNAPFDVLIDFSAPAGTMHWLDQCLTRKAAMVIGATGHSKDQLDHIAAAARTIPILKATNFSLGVNLLLSMVADAARRLGDAYDIEIIEHHHNQKVDAPSGTALSLLDEIVRATNRNPDTDVVFGRSGRTGVRPQRQIGVHAVRMGGAIGHHEVHFASSGETLTLQHTAHARDAFAQGALQAAAWLPSQPPALYSMRDLLTT